MMRLFSWTPVTASFFALLMLTGCSRADKGGSYQVSGTTGIFDHSHAAFTRILNRNVSNEEVDYATLKNDPAALGAYLETLAAVPKQTFNSWNRDQQMAFLINLYNAATL